ncbi:MAG: hypothetical protein OER88_11425, partial [Planctomycetota bacterium]|nr:hypothetical protein [Planctomycetota bacterium]
CEIKNPGKLVVFLVAMRRWVEGAVPGMTEWSVREYGTKKYTRIKINGPAEWNLDKPSIYYAVAANGLTVALDEAVLKRALDRADLPAEAVQARANKAPWIGQHLAMHGERRFLEIMDRVMQSDSFLAKMQTQSFGNLFVLNEWKRLFPKEDPVAVHRRFFGTTPVCPGNGRYVWNERAKTMESTVFGHPFAPKGADLVPPYAKWASMSAGATFEEDGLRARLRLTRSR